MAREGGADLGGISRRRFFRVTGAAALGGSTLLSLGTAVARPQRQCRPTVAVLGGGVAGLTAAHELVERGFDVTVYERRELGGKARSIPVPGSGRGRRSPLPGEHGYRISMGTYQYLPETMSRIPLPDGGTVKDNLVDVNDFLFARWNGREDFNALVFGPPGPVSAESLAREGVGLVDFGRDVPPTELALAIRKIAMYLTSSEERRFGEWEYLSMWDYFEADGKSEAYRSFFTGGLSHFIQSTPPKLAAARTHMNLYEAVLYSIGGLMTDGAPFARILNAPTNEAWINPWIRHLRRQGVKFRIGWAVERLEVDDREIRSAIVRRPGRGRARVSADWFVCAVPVERARKLLVDRRLLRADPRLEDLRRFPTRWMNGIQFFLHREKPLNRGHVAYVDSPWTISSVNQAQFWDRDFRREYGDGSVGDCLSVIVSDWRTPGILYGKPARECSPRQIAAEVWAQMEAHLEDTGRDRLRAEDVHSWFLDPSIQHAGPRTRSQAPLFIATPGLQDRRPGPAGRIENLFLAADYVRNSSPVDSATMDGANAAARAAVNKLLERSGFSADPSPVYERYTAAPFVAAKQVDAARFRRGQPHLLDIT